MCSESAQGSCGCHPVIAASDIITDPHEAREFASDAADKVALMQLYNHCLRCGRKIKAPQQYGRVCARKIKEKDEKALTIDKQRPLLKEVGV